jgi:hypothetical protein
MRRGVHLVVLVAVVLLVSSFGTAVATQPPVPPVTPPAPAPAPAAPAVSAPRIVDGPSIGIEGDLLSCDARFSGYPLHSESVLYEWLLDGALVGAATNYRLQSQDADHDVTYRVTVTNPAGSASATSVAVRIPGAKSGSAASQAPELPVRLTDAAAETAAKAALEQRYGIRLRAHTGWCVHRTSLYARCAASVGRRRLRADVRGATAVGAQPRVKVLRPWPVTKKKRR